MMDHIDYGAIEDDLDAIWHGDIPTTINTTIEKIMTESDLHREYARVIDMCRNTEIKPYTCVRVRGTDMVEVPNLLGDPEDYTFAFAILHGRPIFAGDEVWSITSQQWETISGMHAENVLKTGGHWDSGNLFVGNVRWDKPNTDYDHLIAAHKSGKRIGYTNNHIVWPYSRGGNVSDYRHPPSAYRIVPDDETYNVYLYKTDCYDVNIVLVKDGTTGKFTAEVIEAEK